MIREIYRRLVWKPVYQYRHKDANETVEIHRHRITQRMRRVWYRGLYYDVTPDGDGD